MTAKTIRTIKDEVRNLCQRKRALTYEKMVDIIKERHPEANTSVKTGVPIWARWGSDRARTMSSGPYSFVASKKSCSRGLPAAEIPL